MVTGTATVDARVVAVLANGMTRGNLVILAHISTEVACNMLEVVLVLLQLVQVVGVVPRVRVENSPSPQLMHTVDADICAYVPAVQSMHIDAPMSDDVG